MWLLVIYFGLELIGYFVFKGIYLSGVVESTVKTTKIHYYQDLGIVILEAITIFFIFKKKTADFYLSTAIVSLHIIFAVRGYISPPPNIEITIAQLIKSLFFPIIILYYMIKNKEYFKHITS